ncbi:hypothetical protein ASD21_19985 [Caulobacter sp. Root1455]|uniref:hypothetical protein n=1 Tax=unclassified Caulobacter TaxID=2648921 RepID=UPI0006F63491|nr:MULTISPECIES: hypothetical protein [unclassified Caulobacter]KQY26150.1 hypothetical protein ASD38_20620 [Caulobacter sp. Root487D2Y]KQZ04086.1 hypothetical protein ASD21_19985 [Caulobacter sp. Root1455]
MTRVLYWNIENFAINKIQNPQAKRKRGSSGTEQAASADRLTYISRHVTETDPDIFIVVEVETPYNNNRGVLCGGGGETGMLALLGHLQGLDPNWCLVPPLIAGNKEAVGVFFRADRVTFTGPDQWNGGVGPTVPGLGVPMAQAYPAPWNNCLPVGNYSAARVQFPGTVGMPPPNVNFGLDVRHPYQTTFLDAGGRTINIFTVHSPANFVGATAFLQNMTTMAAIAAPGAMNELRLVLGDFNLTLLRVADSTYTDCYAPLTALGYNVALEPAFGPMPNPLLGYAGYFATHMRPTDSARCWSENQSPAYYPAYFYSGDSNGAANASIDNVLYLAGAGGLPAAAELTVINGVVGSPYANAGANPGGCPQGTQAFNVELNWDWAGLNAQWVNGEAPDIAPQFAQQQGVRAWFHGWGVYGKIRSTSDHLPLFFNG